MCAKFGQITADKVCTNHTGSHRPNCSHVWTNKLGRDQPRTPVDSGSTLVELGRLCSKFVPSWPCFDRFRLDALAELERSRPEMARVRHRVEVRELAAPLRNDAWRAMSTRLSPNAELEECRCDRSSALRGVQICHPWPGAAAGGPVGRKRPLEGGSGLNGCPWAAAGGFRVEPPELPPPPSDVHVLRGHPPQTPGPFQRPPARPTARQLPVRGGVSTPVPPPFIRRNSQGSCAEQGCGKYGLRPQKQQRWAARKRTSPTNESTTWGSSEGAPIPQCRDKLNPRYTSPLWSCKLPKCTCRMQLAVLPTATIRWARPGRQLKTWVRPGSALGAHGVSTDFLGLHAACQVANHT